ncbi:MAG: RNA methyltransferase [Bacilli bacterium]|nr:RNA methyltransferase [Bacilli bacterium]
MLITSLTNDKVKNLVKLQTKKYRDEERKFLVEGDHLVSEAYKTNNLIEIFAVEDVLVTFADIPVTYVTKEVMKKISEQTSSTNIIGVCKYINNKIDENKNIVLLDSIQDPGNLGTIIRSAVAFNFDIVLGDNSVDIYNSKTIRSTEGMIFNVNFIKSNLIDFINNHNDYKYLIADMNNGTDIKNYNKTNKVAIIMGNEGNGISESIRNLDIDYIYIKQSSKCESLNVGVAASILMHELGDINE